jgi:P63C domain
MTTARREPRSSRVARRCRAASTRGWRHRQPSRVWSGAPLTNDIVYKRLAPGVLDELRRVTPRDDKGRTKHRYFQRLTTNHGYPRLREHLGSVVTVMKLSKDWQDFIDKLDMLHPRYGETLMLPFADDDGTGLQLQSPRLFAQRVCAAFRAETDRCSGVSFCARAFPPFNPPRRPSATAAGSLPSSFSGSGSV